LDWEGGSQEGEPGGHSWGKKRRRETLSYSKGGRGARIRENMKKKIKVEHTINLS